ncbi:hypothetical protein ACROYT_G008609 [Oculina patagonica]
MSSQPQCPVKHMEVGCFEDIRDQRALPELLLTARDATSSVYFGENINWNDWANFIDRFTCACATKAKQKNFDYFGIEYYGECWGGMDYDVHGPSGKCQMIEKGACVFEACDEHRNDARLCVGSQLSLYVYTVKMQPTPPPPPPQSTRPPPPPPSTQPPPPPPSTPPPPPPSKQPPPPPPPPSTQPPPPPPSTQPPPPPPSTPPPPPPSKHHHHHHHHHRHSRPTTTIDTATTTATTITIARLMYGQIYITGNHLQCTGRGQVVRKISFAVYNNCMYVLL